MAASIVRSFTLGATSRKVIGLRPIVGTQTWARTAFFRRKNDKDQEKEVTVLNQEEEISVSPLTLAKTLRKRVGMQTVRGYTPPSDVEERLHKLASDICQGTGDWKSYCLENNRIKFKFLMAAMSEFDHYIPNADLTNIHTVGDAITFFSTAVHDTSSYEDITKLDLPPNLHIQLEALRFDPENDTMFDGKTAFPGRPTVISSLKFQRQFKQQK